MPYAVINLQGRVFMASNDDPFRVADQILQKIEAKVILVDIHAEATSEKVSLGWYLDGRVTAVVGTHTHIPTADERVLPKGTAYITDVGMSGPYDGVIGVKKELVVGQISERNAGAVRAGHGRRAPVRGGHRLRRGHRQSTEDRATDAVLTRSARARCPDCKIGARLTFFPDTMPGDRRYYPVPLACICAVKRHVKIRNDGRALSIFCDGGVSGDRCLASCAGRGSARCRLRLPVRNGLIGGINCIPTKSRSEEIARRHSSAALKLHKRSTLEEAFEQFDEAARLAPQNIALSDCPRSDKGQAGIRPHPARERADVARCAVAGGGGISGGHRSRPR